MSIIQNSIEQNDATVADREIRARQPFVYPVDPMLITSMSHYDLSLILFRTWFDFDDGVTAKPNLISSWKFDSDLGAYEFIISADANWSDGSPIVADDLRKNLLRAIENETTYGHAIVELIDVGSFKIISSKVFLLKTRDGQPSEAFFQRMGSTFLAVAPPQNFPERVGRMTSNSQSCGPYVLTSESPDELTFSRNGHYLARNEKAPLSIRIRKLDPKFDIMQFLDGKTWENYVQLNTIISPEAAKKLISSGLPHWTRGHDRVSLLSPLGKGNELNRRREILKLLGWQLQQTEFPKSELNVVAANTLQPFGYPLYNPVRLPKPNVAFSKGTKISIFAQANYAGEFQKQIILAAANKIGLSVDWNAVEPSKFYSDQRKNSGSDYLLMSFGVADPEPTTWMGLVFSDNNFISFDDADKIEFKRVASLKSKEAEVDGFKQLLKSLALKGAYLPLLHFSTLSIGHKNLNFSQIKDRDETVNFARVVLD